MGETEADSGPGLAVASDHLTDMFELLRHALVGRHDLVERVGDPVFDPRVLAWHPNGKVAASHRLKGIQQGVQHRTGGLRRGGSGDFSQVHVVCGDLGHGGRF